MKILIAEDNLVSLKMLTASVCSWGYEVSPVEDGLRAFDLLMRPDGPRLALLDWEMPGLEGIEVCSRLRSQLDLPFRYLMVLTGRDRVEDVVLALDKGADDYVTKPWTPGELRARLAVGQRTVKLHEQLEENARKLALTAQTDDLTQIWNRPAIMKRFGEELARSKREGIPLALLMLDVDHFKHVNDTYGHVVGDQVLKEVARRLHVACRPYDLVGRYGGEEFLAVLSNTPHEKVLEFAQRFRGTIADKPISTDGPPLPVTVSVGVVWFDPQGQADLDTLVRLADIMLYRAKENGRNRVELWLAEESACDIRKAG